MARQTAFPHTMTDLRINGRIPDQACKIRRAYAPESTYICTHESSINFFTNAQRKQNSKCLRDTDYIAVSTFNSKGHEIHPLMQVPHDQ